MTAKSKKSTQAEAPAPAEGVERQAATDKPKAIKWHAAFGANGKKLWRSDDGSVVRVQEDENHDVL